VSPIFLTVAEVLQIHRDQIGRYGGRIGVRDLKLLQSAVAAPQAGVREGYLHADLFEMASAYLFHIARNHPFVDGNKRTAAVTAIVFLALNAVALEAPPAAFEPLIVDVAAGKRTRPEIAQFLRTHSAN
jgi:death-on-curing protein